MRALAAALLLLGAPAAGAHETAPDFRLKDAAGKEWSLAARAKDRAVVVVAFTAGCPILRKSTPAVKKIAADYAKRGVAVVYAAPAPQDTPATIAAEAADFGIELPILVDRDQAVSKALGLTRSAEVAVIRVKDRAIVYRGAIHDQFHYDGQRARPTKRWLEDALDAVLAGREPAAPRTEAFGCFIHYL